MASYPETDSRSTLTFAEQAAQNAFGKHWADPRSRDFKDHGPNWQKLGDVADGVVDRLRRRRDHGLADLDDHQINIDINTEHDTKVPV